MKLQSLFPSKNKSKKKTIILKCLLLQFLFGALRIKVHRQEQQPLSFSILPPPPPLLNGINRKGKTNDFAIFTANFH